jgi:hypothetical protein
MTGGFSTAQVIVVHRRQVVVDEAVGVDQFDGCGRGIEPLEPSAEGLTGHVDEHRTQSLASAQHAVAHRLAEACNGIVPGQAGLQDPFAACLISGDARLQRARVLAAHVAAR